MTISNITLSEWIQRDPELTFDDFKALMAHSENKRVKRSSQPLPSFPLPPKQEVAYKEIGCKSASRPESLVLTLPTGSTLKRARLLRDTKVQVQAKDVVCHICRCQKEHNEAECLSRMSQKKTMRTDSMYDTYTTSVTTKANETTWSGTTCISPSGEEIPFKFNKEAEVMVILEAIMCSLSTKGLQSSIKMDYLSILGYISFFSLLLLCAWSVFCVLLVIYVCFLSIYTALLLVFFLLGPACRALLLKIIANSFLSSLKNTQLLHNHICKQIIYALGTTNCLTTKLLMFCD